MRRISENTKEREKRGTGQGSCYKPYIKAREINSKGTTSNMIDWKHGRTLELLSQAELFVYLDLRWDDNVVDIREQYPLDLRTTLSLADALGIKHPCNRSTRMTTDFLVDYKDGTQNAISVKVSERELENDRTVEKLYLEKMYWASKNIPFKIIYKTDIDVTKVRNIQSVIQYYDQSTVHDSIDMVKHLIAHKLFAVDMSKPIDYSYLTKGIKEVRL